MRLHLSVTVVAAGLLASCGSNEISGGVFDGDGAQTGGDTIAGGGDNGGGDGDGDSVTTDNAPADTDTGTPDTLSEAHPNDVGMADDPAVLFYSGFENDFVGWSSHSTDVIDDAALVTIIDDASRANGGTKLMQARVTKSQLAAQQYISANAQIDLESGVPVMYARYYAKVVGDSSRPHHWVRFAAGDYYDGLANTVPGGDEGFWYDLDLGEDGLLAFYIYWYKMRSGRCNDGTAQPGCAGDQGTTYYYGNNYKPEHQSPLLRDRWICIETMTKANSIGQSDGALALWVDGELIEDYKPGNPLGNFLRDNFFSYGPYFDAGTAQPFPGFDFRSSGTVLPKRLTLDAYYQANTLVDDAPEEQVVHYDDVVLATKRIGCKG